MFTTREQPRVKNVASMLFMTSDHLAEMRASLKSNDRQKLSVLIDFFSQERNQPHLLQLAKQSPEICTEFTEILFKNLKKEKAPANVAVMQKIIDILAHNSVFERAPPKKENVCFMCADGEVRMSKTLLVLRNEHFKKVFLAKHGMQETQKRPRDDTPDSELLYRIDYKNYSMATLLAFKAYLAGSLKFDSLPAITAIELYNMAHYIEDEELKKQLEPLLDLIVARPVVETEFKHLFEAFGCLGPGLALKYQQPFLKNPTLFL